MSAAPPANSPVLIAARAPSLEQRVQSQTRGKTDVTSWHGGNGFLWSGGSNVMTSATWLADVIRLKPSYSRSGLDSGRVPTGVEWELADAKTVFHVIWENTQDHTSKANQLIQPTPTTHANALPLQTKHDAWLKSGLTVAEAEIAAVHVLCDVYRSLEEQIHSLDQWRCELESRRTGGRGREMEEGGEEEGREGAVKFVSVESLLLPLSCVVFLKVKPWPSLPTTPVRCWYYPRVGDKLVSINTPFGSFCPEIFHNTMTSGCVCKLIGQSSGVFLTDTCHLPGTEGAGLRRHLSHSADVVAMVLAPLFTERGTPVGLSLAASLSSLHHTLSPSPHTLSLSPHTLSLSPHTLTPSPNTLSPLTHTPTVSPMLGGNSILLDSRTHSGNADYARLEGVCRLVVAVVTSSWGSGILLSSNKVLTCAHIVNPPSGSVSVYLPWSQCPVPLDGSVVEWNPDMDLAIIELKQSLVDGHILDPLQDQFITQPLSRPLSMAWKYRTPREYQSGPVYAIGYEAPPWHPCGPLQPLVTEGTLCKVVSDKCGGEGVMLVTSAVVLSGMSGGVIVSGEDGRLLAMIVSNSKDMTMGHTYPNVNYSLSLPWLLPSITTSLSTGTSDHLRQFMSENGGRVKQLWTLTSELVLPHPPSKL